MLRSVFAQTHDVHTIRCERAKRFKPGAEDCDCSFTGLNLVFLRLATLDIGILDCCVGIDCIQVHVLEHVQVFGSAQRVADRWRPENRKASGSWRVRLFRFRVLSEVEAAGRGGL